MVRVAVVGLVAVLVLGGLFVALRPDPPAEAATLSLEADLTGRFEVEDHDTGAELGTLVVEPRSAG